MRARMFTAQPLASSSGPRLRRRSLSQASSIEGPDTSSIKPSNTNGIFHAGSDRNPLKMAASAVPRAPTAKPAAAKMPANLAMSKAAGAVLGAGATGLPALSTLSAVATLSPAAFTSEVEEASIFLSWARANFWTCSPTMRARRL